MVKNQKTKNVRKKRRKKFYNKKMKYENTEKLRERKKFQQTEKENMTDE